jgi:autotransporter-associated beta strand protein
VTIAAAGKYTVAVTTADTANSLTLDNFTTTLQESATGSLTLTGALTVDAGVAVLNGANSIGGGVTIGGAGILEVGKAAALGTGPLTIDGGLLLGTVNETLTNPLQLNGTLAIAAAPGTTLNLNSTTPWTLTNGSTVVFGPAGQNGTVIWHSAAGSQISDEGGATIEVEGGTLKAGDDRFTFLFFNSPQTLVAAGATIDLAGFGAQFVNPQGTGTVTDSGGAANVILSNSNFAGTLSGALSLEVLGPVTLTGTNTYTGATSLVINSLTLGNGGTTGSIAGHSAVNDGTSLIFDRSNAYTVANVISGTGSVQQIGTGTTTLTAANSYSGGTTITAGTLAAANAHALGTGPVNLAGGELLATTNVTITSLALSGSVTLAAAKGATLDIAPPLTLSLTQASGDTLTFGAPGENGTVIWTPPALGELALNGTIDLDTLIVQDGILKGAVAPGNPAIDDLPTNVVLQTVVDAAGTIDIAGAQDQINDLQGAGSVTDSVGGGTLTLDAGDFAGTIKGNLNLTTMGTVTLTGAETYAGSTTIDSGSTLTLGNGGASGSLASQRAVIDNGTLVFDRSNAVTLANLISGTGAVEQTGTGTTTLTGANTYSGGTTIAAGTLAVGNASALGTGPLTMTGGELLGTTTETLTNTLNLNGPATIAAATGTTLTLDSGNPWSLTGAGTLTFGAPGQDGVVI